ncbi:hypothetical protein SMMN14_08998 [Sphaerulina musiva]
MARETTLNDSAIVCSRLDGAKRAPEDLLGVRYGAELVWFRMPCKGTPSVTTDRKIPVDGSHRRLPQ